ncbi:uncharacterized protein PHALS_10530 [Plasmopara halstedii]|uniref:Uncharacterized protein n=1 Tax=Plasmopara halstedii TaxID=4781 RepID=A0A0P1AHZ9_PLAHL|nr:uncharacterized protein PHALS_10530 [Plasmopara halstedii]CEG40324.1 hypothetical protein PHALS_10530 [Plasmopara halstedii]|eukprot:XP_024576693.1 hypothetical protein PHALS_10530 [Plasmopara halstedii]
MDSHKNERETSPNYIPWINVYGRCNSQRRARVIRNIVAACTRSYLLLSAKRRSIFAMSQHVLVSDMPLLQRS